jgi:hypothetical protein
LNAPEKYGPTSEVVLVETAVDDTAATPFTSTVAVVPENVADTKSPTARVVVPA